MNEQMMKKQRRRPKWLPLAGSLIRRFAPNDPALLYFYCILHEMAKKGIDGGKKSWYDVPTPTRKRSTSGTGVKESSGGCDRGANGRKEWTFEGEPNGPLPQ
ncbi:MAG: hypothetical protein IKH57_19250 [Clostridia bacterium]|nr:hypothetical protein [Clostridia bacterium]